MPNTVEHTLFSSAQETFTKTDLILDHKTYPNKFKSTKIISSVFTDHNRMKLEIIEKYLKKSPNSCKLKNVLLNS